MAELERMQQTVTLARYFVDTLARHGIRLVTYVADHVLTAVVDALAKDPRFTLVTATREEEGLGIVMGAYLGGVRGAVFMQSSGLGLCVNALASVALPYQIPLLMVVGLRGDLGEYNIAQLRMGQTVPEICRMLGIPCEVVTAPSELQRVLPGLMEMGFKTGTPVCLAVRRTVLEDPEEVSPTG